MGTLLFTMLKTYFTLCKNALFLQVMSRDLLSTLSFSFCFLMYLAIVYLGYLYELLFWLTLTSVSLQSDAFSIVAEGLARGILQYAFVLVLVPVLLRCMRIVPSLSAREVSSLWVVLMSVYAVTLLPVSKFISTVDSVSKVTDLGNFLQLVSYSSGTAIALTFSVYFVFAHVLRKTLHVSVFVGYTIACVMVLLPTVLTNSIFVFFGYL